MRVPGQPQWSGYLVLLILCLGLLFTPLFALTPLFARAQPRPIEQTPRIHDMSETRYYTIRPGDTIYSVALEIGVDLAETYCLVAPDFTLDKPLVIGDVLEVPPAGTHCHPVAEGETLNDLIDQYDTTAEALQSNRWNSLSDMRFSTLAPNVPLPAGHHLRIPPLEQNRPVDLNTATAELTEILAMPADTLPFVAFAVGGPNLAAPQVEIPKDWPYGSGHFRWPTGGWLSQGFHAGHRAVDIAAPYGSAVRAADRGVVIRAGWNWQGYGKLVIIDHKIDYVTLYAHLSEVYVEEGDIVGQGDLIGAVGSTGNSTGAHLHFEIRDFGQRTDPLDLLTRSFR